MSQTQTLLDDVPAPIERAPRFYGKYRGSVVNNVDPMRIGRIQAQVPDVLGVTPSSWALPCFPSAGRQAGSYVVPQVGAGVWIEFEGGDPDRPIWVGGWFANAAEVPALGQLVPPGLETFQYATTGQYAVSISDVPGSGGFLVKSPTGAIFQVNDTGIVISNGKGASIALVGPTTTINAGALTVT